MSVRCLTGRDLWEFDYISVGHAGFVPMNVRPMILTRLEPVDAATCNDVLGAERRSM
jgi:hypothetical protein